jgi:hypothetical protein
MLITIIYNTEFRDEAGSLKNDILEEWSDTSVNMMGIRDSISGATYQVQHEGGIVYRGTTVGDNTTIINSIKARL